MDFNKEIIGERIAAVPTGNNAPRRGRAPIAVFQVIAVGRKYVLLKDQLTGREDRYCMETGATEDSIRRGYCGNAGFLFFKSEEDAERYQAKVLTVSRLFSRFRETLRSDLMNLSDEDLDALNSLLDKADSA